MSDHKVSSLSRKLYTTFVISFILPMLFICLFICYLFSLSLYRESLQQATTDTRLISGYLTKYIREIDNIMRASYSVPYLHSKTTLDNLSASEKNNLSSEMASALTGSTYSREDFGDLLFLSQGEVLYFNTENYYEYLPSQGELTTRNWYKEALRQDGKLAFVPYQVPLQEGQKTEANSFYISRQLKNIYNPHQENVMLLHIKTGALNSLFADLSATSSSIILLTKDTGELLYANTPITSDLLNKLHQDKINYDKTTWLHQALAAERYPITVHVLFSTDYITRQNVTFLTVSILCLCVGLFLAYLLFDGHNKWIKLPVLHIQAILGKMKKGNLDVRCSQWQVQEFDEIGTSINEMATKLQEKIKNEYELTLSQKNLEFQALQSQIQPHFIINTIYNFISLNQLGETELLNDALYAFTRLLRYVLSRDSETTLAKELDFIESYCSLYKLRFGHRFTYHIDYPEALATFAMPKLLLQPLVENAILHGIEPSELPCVLNITVETHQDTLYIIIEDTGVGFTKEQLTSPNSIGIKNVENRIALWDKHVKLYLYRINHQSIQIIIIPTDFKETTDENHNC
jgi:sensor histidine kinase YesM